MLQALTRARLCSFAPSLCSTLVEKVPCAFAVLLAFV